MRATQLSPLRPGFPQGDIAQRRTPDLLEVENRRRRRTVPLSRKKTASGYSYVSTTAELVKRVLAVSNAATEGPKTLYHRNQPIVHYISIPEMDKPAEEYYELRKSSP